MITTYILFPVFTALRMVMDGMYFSAGRLTLECPLKSQEWLAAERYLKGLESEDNSTLEKLIEAISKVGK